jgi:hypothetical protein
MTYLCSLEEFTGLMKGQIAARNIDEVIKETFAVFGEKSISMNLLQEMVQVNQTFFLFRCLKW